MEQLKLGIIGCGNISDAYLTGGARSRLVAVKSVADLYRAGGAGQGGRLWCRGGVVRADARRPRDRHRHQPHRAAGACRGQPSRGRGRQARLFREAVRGDLRRGTRARGSRPRQGPASRLRPRHVPGRRPSGGAASDRRGPDRPRRRRVRSCFATPGMEGWHPNPSFFFKRGGGPVLDIGCYPITQLVNCLGPG